MPMFYFDVATGD
jgi:bifunctional non-homologous end joining protein LigD